MIRILPIIILISIFLGCSSSSPPPKLYTLNSISQTKAAPPLSTKEGNVVFGIGPVEIPDYLDKPQIVTRTSENELMMSEFNLWGGSLNKDIMRVLVENTSSLLNSDNITVVSWKAAANGSYRVPVYILRFDASADNAISFKAKWGIIAKDGKTVGTIKEFSTVKPMNGKDYKDIVHSMSDVLADFSKEIASVIQVAAKEVTAR